MSAEKNDKYNLLLKQVQGLLNPSDPVLTNICNFIAAINETFPIISWIGFYFIKDNILYLGPFQGKTACTKIKMGKGVCGTAAIELKTQVVENVQKFPGHIACDAESNSEIVIPLLNEGKVYGVLDLDSKEFSAFDNIDREWLEKICSELTNKIDLSKVI